MSWFIGAFPNGNGIISKEFFLQKTAFLPEHRLKICTKQLCLIAGGIAETCQFSVAADETSGWVAAGVGIHFVDGLPTLMTGADWSTVFAGAETDLSSLNGHFAAIGWQNRRIRFFTDPLGLRNIFFREIDGVMWFASRIDWLAGIKSGCKIELETFSAHWLLINQLSQESGVTGVRRLCQGGIATAEPGKFTLTNHEWLPDKSQNFSEKSMPDLLRDFTVCTLGGEKTLSLGLSGGLDSRVLLAQLLNQPKNDWAVHTFNVPEHPDRKIAGNIASVLGIPQTVIPAFFPDTEKIFEILKNYVGQTRLSSPASGFINVQFYSYLHHLGKIVIDGGSGEIARRRYLNMLLLRGKTALLNGNVSQILPFLHVHRANIFTAEVQLQLENSLAGELENVWSQMPDIRHFGVENWLDLFAIRTRFPNFAGPEQSRSDSELVNFMPFVQPAFLQKMFETPVRERDNGRMFRKIIRENYPSLTRFSLVKDGIVYPYPFKTISASLWMKGKRKFGKVYVEQNTIHLLTAIEPQIRGLLDSATVRQSNFYDYQMLQQIVDGFYSGDQRHAKALDWWLAFELYRQQIEQTM